ncbi:hypothetical protein DEFDS_P147 (plasmid) [Deferribacter desulfuricans SSM1]|uniref:Ankyrin repeat protein n=1 Tax=Deferribacter desulfuricans (strain DSM 14783 / JCM 11476 / NBRC 101012 / SSM1) TaxID=639282 RepID=D3PEX6_DEFDS|nr:hypothetical protein [Deferribacter desulfuricans]BAI81768.1 hypothetical protein DEFDS_P147 [Deferribacter desulfuricans SSM1]
MTYEEAYKEIKQGHFFEDKEVLKISDSFGWTIAHIQANRYWTTDDKEILKLADKKGWSVAHEQAINGWTTEDKEILRLADKTGLTVAHILASRGVIFTDKEILSLSDNNGLSVAHVMVKKDYMITDTTLWFLKHNVEGYVAHHMMKRGFICKYKKILDYPIPSYEKSFKVKVSYVYFRFNSFPIMRLVSTEDTNLDVVEINKDVDTTIELKLSKKIIMFDEKSVNSENSTLSLVNTFTNEHFKKIQHFYFTLNNVIKAAIISINIC